MTSFIGIYLPAETKRSISKIGNFEATGWWKSFSTVKLLLKAQMTQMMMIGTVHKLYMNSTSMVLMTCWLDTDDFRIWAKSLLARCGLVPQLRYVLVKSSILAASIFGRKLYQPCLKIAPFPQSSYVIITRFLPPSSWCLPIELDLPYPAPSKISPNQKAFRLQVEWWSRGRENRVEGFGFQGPAHGTRHFFGQAHIYI